MRKPTEFQMHLFDDLHNSRTEDFKTFNKKSYRGVWSSIIDKYPETAHFVYELLQNADDAEATEVHIILQYDRMLFKHNGIKHFDVTKEDAELIGDINSITGIGDSSKTDLQNKIGKFGVGFKAVFQYTDSPEIYDDVFKFKIENYIIPTLLPYDHPERLDGETLFVFPFKEYAKSYQEIRSRLEKLQNPILFLRHLQRIVWRIDNEDGRRGVELEYSKEVLDTVEYDNITLEHYRLVEPTGNANIILFSQRVVITDIDNKQSSHLINVGYYYDPISQKLITDNIHNIFCFFPTKETFKTCFVSHGPFLLTDNRQNLKPGEKLNKDLINMIAKLAAVSLINLRDYEIEKGVHLIDENITEIIPNYTTNYWKELDSLFEKPIKDAFNDLLINERILLSRNGNYLSMQEAFMGTPRELVDLLNQQQLIMLRSCAYKDIIGNKTFDVKNIDFLKWELIQNINNSQNDIFRRLFHYKSENFAADIKPEFMDKQEVKWVTRMYTFLRTSAPKLWKITDKDRNKQANILPFRKATIIKTQKGEWVAPFIDGDTPNVYLPLKDDNQSDYNFIAKEYLEDDMAKKFFAELEIKEPDEEDYIRQVIMGKFKGEDICINEDDLTSDFIVLLAYYKKIKEDLSKCTNFINLLKSNNFLICGTDDRLHQPNQLYFPDEHLLKYFSAEDKCVFFNYDVYETVFEKFSNDIINKFVSELGVKSYPSICKKSKTNVQQLNNRIRSQISTDEYAAYHIDDYELEGFDDFCRSKTLSKDISLYLWNEVLPKLNFNNYDSLTIVYRKKYARSKSKAYYTSTFKDSLLHQNWLFDVNDNIVSAYGVSLEDLAPEYNKGNGLVQFLNIEKREKSILELGGTEEQQEQLNLGKRIKNIAGDKLTYDEILQAISEATAKKESSSNTINEVSEGWTKTDVSDAQKEEFGKLQENNINAEQNCINREELRRTSLTKMFVHSNHKTECKSQEVDDISDTDEVDAVMQKLFDQEERHNKIKELRDIAHSSEKYSKEWFDALIELEYRGNADNEYDESSKFINISFNSVQKERGCDCIYVFSNPSRNVPMWMEEIGDIEVKYSFSNQDELTLKFEVANVRDNSLRLKASKAYEAILSKIEWTKCTKASITLKNQIDLMGKVRIAFNRLNLKNDFNLKENLQDNIRFIFGPPGTGKTTTLAKRIISQMSAYPTSRILVLAPTNTACDELARKILHHNGDCSWMHRFVSTADEELEDFVIDRESMAYEDEKCCIISTIARLSFDGFNGIGGNNRLTDIVWDMVICDEASMIPLAEICLAIYNFTDTPILIAGDPKQIKPILREEEWKDENIYTMVNLDRFDNPITEPIQFEIENLNIQYRSVPAIGELFSQYAYNGKLKHHRASCSQDVHWGKLLLKPISFIPFKVEKYDSIFGIKKLDGSNVHIYSAIFTVELLKYFISVYSQNKETEFSIGIVCPYSPQAQLIESLVTQISNIPQSINVTVGTVHRFQGGQCNLMIVVLNPPLGMKVASDKIFLNNQNIMNVSISRAQDYLCILLPHQDTEGYENLYEINNIGRIAMTNPNEVISYTCDQIEEIIFGRKFYIENNTFVTSHQLTNVYTKTSKKYEVRIDEKSIDIQLGDINRIL